MENASKALLIAGAILIVLLIISLSVIIYNSVTGSAQEEQNQLTAQEIQMFNKQFTKYAGKNINAINVQNLINAVNSNNAKHPEGEMKYIELIGQTSFGIGGSEGLPTNELYDVSITLDENTGLVKEVVIELNELTLPQ